MLLEKGNVIELKKGHTVYAEVPEHFAYANKVGCFDLTKTEVPICGNKNGLNTDFMGGLWIVTNTSYAGGGCWHGSHDVYPGGHRVECERAVGKSYNYKMKISFYQTGCFTAMIREGEVKVVGQAKAEWSAEWSVD